MRWGIAIIILLILLFWWLRDGGDKRVPEPTPRQAKVIKKSKPAVRTPRYASQRKGDRYPQAVIEKLFRRDSLPITHCFLEAKSKVEAAELHLKSTWDGMANLKALEIEPKVAKSTFDCIEDRLSTWRLPPHPNRAPFTFEQTLTF